MEKDFCDKFAVDFFTFKNLTDTEIKNNLDKALDLIVDLQPDFVCEELNALESDYCANNCTNFNKECVLRYLKYYKKYLCF